MDKRVYYDFCHVHEVGGVPALRPKPKQSELVLEFQQRVGPYERACVLEDGMRVADVTFIGGGSMKKIVDVFRAAGVQVTIDEFISVRGKK